MAKRMTGRRIRLMDQYPKGCDKPEGYGDFFDWAEAQTLHGLEQKYCEGCHRWLFPQQKHGPECPTLSGRT